MGMTVEEYRKIICKQQKGNKLNAVNTNIDGLEFASKSEAKRYAELKMLQAAGEISDLRTQVKYVLIPSQRGDNGKVIEKECSYIADFVYHDNRANKTIVEDVKGYSNPASATYAKFVIKRKLMLYIHGIRVVEVKY
jgi:hypothetical protein